MEPNLDDLLSVLLTELNIPGCLRDINTFWGYRSTVPGPGLRQVSEFLLRRHAENGISVKLHAFPADDHTRTVDDRSNPLAWTPRSATLEIVQPSGEAQVICSYAREPLCLLSNSTSTPPDGLTAEVVVLHSGTQAEDYAEIDVAGKIVFTDVWPLLADPQARNHGAAGLITDSVTPPWLLKNPPVRRPADVPDLTMWGVLDGRRNEIPLWGFSLTPRQGENLRRLLRESKQPVLLRAHVDASLSEGTSELIEAVIPGTGQSPQEIWLLSHSSEPGALDDASGCCLSLEIARTLNGLIASGRLPRPHRTIRFLNAVETEGYFPYIHALCQNGEIKKVVAAMALDSVGSDFRKSGGSQRLFRNPDANPSFVDALAEHLLSLVAAMPNERFTSDTFDIFSWRSDPNFPGNDNFIADGFFDIPTPMLCNWPDKFYHSNLDTVDKLSSNSLGRSGLIAAAYVYILACSTEVDAPWLAGLALKHYKQRLVQTPSSRLAWEGTEALRGLPRLFPASAGLTREAEMELEEFARREMCSTLRLSPAEPSGGFPKDNAETDFIPLPMRWELSMNHLVPHDEQQLHAIRQQHAEIDRVWAHINGRRSAACIAAGLDLSISAVIEYLGLLHRHGWIERADIEVKILAANRIEPALAETVNILLRMVFGADLDSLLWAQDDWRVLIFKNGILAAHVGIVDRTVLAGAEKIRVGGIGGVATRPEFRGLGLASLAMQRAANFMSGEYAADAGLLMCGAEMLPFYQGLGWLPINDPMIFDQPSGKMPNEGQTCRLPCNRADWPVGTVDLCGYPW